MNHDAIPVPCPPMKTPHWSRPFLIAVLMLLLVTPGPALARQAVWVGETLQGRPCNDFAGRETRTNVFDYTDPSDRANHLEIVERAHFTDKVRSLRGGEHQSHPLNDLAYTVGRFPNHHGALYSMIRYATESLYAREARNAWASVSRGGAFPPPECYLQRAMDFAPEDHEVRLLAGLYFHRVDAHEQARKAYEKAVSLAPESAEVHYNYGLLLLDMKRYTEAREHGAKAYDLGYPLDGLRQKLAAAGHPIDR
ncbi:MAG: tetratricopeptide repeat protein [Halofilum sp. (in: g-proteobacteria)]|nr:tetratricopeptide repeat protein [Halofilum sp. (in: g-proteobacteria)]